MSSGEERANHSQKSRSCKGKASKKQAKQVCLALPCPLPPIVADSHTSVQAAELSNSDKSQEESSMSLCPWK